MDDLRKRFGRLVYANRRRCKFTQQELSDRAGISIEMINRIERGVVGARFPNIEKLAAALDVDPAELFTPDLVAGEPSPSPDRRDGSLVGTVRSRTEVGGWTA